MTLPLRNKSNSRMGTREGTGPLRCAPHLQWIRGFKCCVDNAECAGSIQAAHVRTGTDGSMGKKPGDDWAISLCAYHHMLQHQGGEEWFERAYKIDMQALAIEFAAASPALRKCRVKDERNGN